MKRFLSIALCLVLAVGALIVPSRGESADTAEKATAMKELGIFKGTNKGLELDRQPTRAEGLVMFIRMLGAEQDALSRTYYHPFTDVPDWADHYVGYAYSCGLTSGISSTNFGAGNLISAGEYVTFILRALGYDASADFSWETAIEKAVEIHLVTDTEAERLRSQKATRSTMVDLSWSALTQPFKDSTGILASDLIDKGVFTMEQAVAYGLLEEVKKPYAADTLARTSVDGQNAYLMMTLDENDDLIYYDMKANTIIHVDLDTKTAQTLLDAESASCTIQWTDGTVNYQNLEEIYQIFWDSVRDSLMIYGTINPALVDSDGWTSGTQHSSCTGLFQWKDGRLQYVSDILKSPEDLILTVLGNGHYIASREHDTYGPFIYDPDTDEILNEISEYYCFWAAQLGNTIYFVSTGSAISKYNFETNASEDIADVSNVRGICTQNNLIYSWFTGLFNKSNVFGIVATRTTGEQRILCDFSKDLEVLDMTPMPEKVRALYGTKDGRFIFYDESAKAIRVICPSSLLA